MSIYSLAHIVMSLIHNTTINHCICIVRTQLRASGCWSVLPASRIHMNASTEKQSRKSNGKHSAENSQILVNKSNKEKVFGKFSNILIKYTWEVSPRASICNETAILDGEKRTYLLETLWETCNLFPPFHSFSASDQISYDKESTLSIQRE